MRNAFSADELARSALRLLALCTAGISILMICYLLIESLSVLESVGPLRFWTDRNWSPSRGSFGLTPMLLGTLWVSVGAVVLSTPFALASALFGRFFVKGIAARAFRRLLETLAGIPSVLFGLWGLNVLVPRIATISAPGQSVLAGILVLSLMILPTIALLADSALAVVPEFQLRAGAAVGLSRWGMIRGIVLPSARSGIVAGVLLGAGRALGETMAVVMVMGNVVRVPTSLFDPARTLTANIALEMAYASEAHRSALFVSGLVLASLTILLVWASAGMDQRAVQQSGAAHGA